MGNETKMRHLLTFLYHKGISETWIYKQNQNHQTFGFHSWFLHFRESDFEREWRDHTTNQEFRIKGSSSVAPLRVNIKPMPLKKISLWGLWQKKLSCYMVEWVEAAEIYMPQVSSVVLPRTPYKNTAVRISDIPVISIVTAEWGSNFVTLSYHIKKKSVQMDILITRWIFFWYIFIKDITYKISYFSNQIKAAAAFLKRQFFFFLKAPDHIQMLPKLALSYNGTIFFKTNIEYLMGNGTASCIFSIYFPCFLFNLRGA